MFRKRFGITAFLLVVLGGAGVMLPEPQTPAADPGQLELVVNVAARRLDVYENGKRTRTYSVSPGSNDYRTPLGNYRIHKVIWNPWWHPPNSAWARGRKPEAPGPANPMGRVKLNFSELLYIHGTPLEHELGQAASHGCIRMANRDVIELARLVHRYASPGLKEAVLDGLESSPQSTRNIALRKPVKLSVTYQLAEVRNGRLEIHRDVYRTTPKIAREKALNALAKAGYEASAVHAERLDSFLKQSPRGGLIIPLESLIDADLVASSSSPSP